MAAAAVEQPAELLEDGGVMWRLKLSKKNKNGGGYLNVVEPRPGEFHAKPKIGGKQETLPGGACKTAKEAALRFAKYEASPYPIIKKDPDRAAKGFGKVCVPLIRPHTCMHISLHDCVSAHVRQRSLAKVAKDDEEKRATYVPPTSWPAWVVCTNTYEIWQAGIELPTELQLSAEAAAQVMRIKFFAAEQARRLKEGPEQSEDEEEPLLPPSHVPLIPPATPIMTWEAAAEHVAAIKAGESYTAPRLSPDTVIAQM